MALSDSWLKAVHGKEQAKTEKADRDGLSVRVSAKGKVTFQMRFRYAGKPQRCDLGSYPLLSLKDARLECQRYRAELEQGSDPRIIKALELTEKQDGKTVGSAFLEWYETSVAGKIVSAENNWASISNHVLPKIGRLPLDKVTLHHWLSILEPLAKVTPAMAERVLTQCRKFLRWAVRRHLVADNPLLNITAKDDLHVKRNRGERTLDYSELALLLEFFESRTRMALKNILFMKLCLLFGCRNGELRRAKKSHFDFDKRVWYVPPENRKVGKDSGRAHERPIPPEFDETIKALMAMSNCDYVVPLTGSNEPMTSSASLSLSYNVMQWVRKNKGIDMKHWSLHDLRRTARTNFGDLNKGDKVVPEIMIDHTLPGDWHTYDQGFYLKDAMRIYKSWYRRLHSIAGGHVVSNVVEMKRG